MIPIIIKELKENAKWAALLFVASGLALAMGLYQSDPTSYWIAIAGGVTTLGAAAAGLLLGILQTVLEAGRDRWAFLVHRPISRTRIFLAKAIAGMTLMLLAVGGPFALSLAWMAVPGNYPAPLYGGMALGGVADLLAGCVYYFAGMVIGMRQARWYGTRAMSLGLGITASGLVWVMPDFWKAAVAATVLAAIGAVAAWGCFIGGGDPDAQPPAARFCLRASVLTGLAWLTVLAAAVVASMLAPRYRDAYARYEFDTQGNALRVEYLGGSKVRITDPQGKAVPQERDLRNTPPPFLRGQTYLTVSDWRLPAILRDARYRAPGRYMIELWGDPDRQRWFYCVRDGLIRGYDVRTGQPVGTIDRDGFHPDHQPATRPFVGRPVAESPSAMLLTFPDAVYGLDLADRSVRLIWTAPGDDPALAAAVMSDEDRPRRFVVLTRRAIHVLESDGRPVMSTPVLRDGTKYRVLTIGPLPQERGWLVRYLPNWGNASALPEFATVLAPDGKLLRQEELPPLSAPQAQPAAARYAGLLLPPITPAVDLALVHITALDEDGSENWWQRNRTDIVAYMTFSMGMALACAVAMVLLARRYALGTAATNAWGVVGLLFGVTGLLTMLGTVRWPARVACSGCGRPRVVTRDRCEHCGAAFAPPRLQGIEILEEIVA